MSENKEREITNKQSAVLLFINNHIKDQGFPPTFREIMNGLELWSTNAVNGHLVALERKGYIVTFRGKARGMVMTDKTRKYVKEITKCKNQTTN